MGALGIRMNQTAALYLENVDLLGILSQQEAQAAWRFFTAHGVKGRLNMLMCIFTFPVTAPVKETLVGVGCLTMRNAGLYFS